KNENRRWPTSYRGPLAIHAGKGTQYLTRRELADYPSGAIVAVADLVACLPLRTVRERGRSGVLDRLDISVADFLAHEHTEGPWCWILNDAAQLATPLPCRGSQGLWGVPDDHAAGLLAAYPNV
ncbi:MAG: ASCH domain-containing protein, partial [Planctomycetota bacterium]